MRSGAEMAGAEESSNNIVRNLEAAFKSMLTPHRNKEKQMPGEAMQVCTYVCVYVCMYVCTYVCVRACGSGLRFLRPIVALFLLFVSIVDVVSNTRHHAHAHCLSFHRHTHSARTYISYVYRGHLCVYVCVYVCVCVCMCVCMCVYVCVCSCRCLETYHTHIPITHGSRDVLCCVSCRVVACPVVSCRGVSCRIVACLVVSCRMVVCRVVSCRIVACLVLVCRVTALGVPPYSSGVGIGPGIRLCRH